MQLQKEIEGLIADIAVANKDFNGLKAEVGAHLECFAAEEAQRLASWPEPLPAHEDNLDQVDSRLYPHPFEAWLTDGPGDAPIKALTPPHTACMEFGAESGRLKFRCLSYCRRGVAMV